MYENIKDIQNDRDLEKAGGKKLVKAITDLPAIEEPKKEETKKEEVET